MYNVVVVVNGGKNVIPRKLLDELANAAGADTWECVDLPAESRPTKRAADCANCGANNWLSAGFPVTTQFCGNCGASR